MRCDIKNDKDWCCVGKLNCLVPVNQINTCNLMVKTINFKQNDSSLTHKYQVVNIFTINSLI